MRGAADRDVVEALADEAQRLVALALGLDDVGGRLVPVEERRLEARQLEEPVLLARATRPAACGWGTSPSTRSSSV